MPPTPLQRLLAGLAALAAACTGPSRGAPPAPAAETPAPETVYTGGVVRVAAGERVEALLVRGSLVAAAGDLDAVLAAARGPVRTVDLAGATLVPGLHDAHAHLANLGRSLDRVALVGAESYAEVVRRTAERAAQRPAGTWILGRGWDQNLWGASDLPHHRELSAGVPDHPVLLRRVDGHAALLNRRALEAAGLYRRHAAPPEVPGGEVLLDDEGWPTGVLVDRAMDLATAVLPPESDAEIEARLLAAQREVVSHGLVAVHDMGLEPHVVRALGRLVERGEWHLLVYAYLRADGALDDALVDEARALFATGPVRLSGIKVHADGALGSRGAALLADYADRPGHRGLQIVPRDELRALFERALAWDLQPAVHAIGDRANRVLLDVVEELASEGRPVARLRPRAEHAQVVAPEDLGRFEALGVVASVQPTHATSDMGWAGARLGPGRLRGAYAWRDLAADPHTLALGSDFPVEAVDPLLGLHAARTRQDARGEPAGGFFPEQRLTGEEALAGFTVGAARAACDEARRGRLAPGYAADLTVLDVDPVDAPPADLLRGRALLTVIGGREVWRHAEPGE